MACIYITFATLILVAISICHSLPVEKHSKSEVGGFVPGSVKGIAVTDKSVNSEETSIVPVFGVDSVTDGHKILKRSPRAGVIVVDKCPAGEIMSFGGCIKCEGDCSDINNFDESEFEK